ncbi:MAG: hypothetical protein EPO65_01470 [Dehalococcoidia bacterium]|nr:MAG: hypothetical protein EPO65_01470 [Dehalococcoidia bacterium]
MAQTSLRRAHLVLGGFPVGSPALHDMDYARLQLLGVTGSMENVYTTLSGDYADIEKWLSDCQLLITYTAGPYPSEEQTQWLRGWIEAGGRWFGLHGSSGGRAAPVPGKRQRQMVKLPYHDLLGGFFLNHPPLRDFRVDVADTAHPLMKGVPTSFETRDEPYMLEIQHPEDTHVLLTAELGPDLTPERGFYVEKDTALLPDGKTRVLGYSRQIGRGTIVYYALGHNTTQAQWPSMPGVFRGSWEKPAFQTMVRNAIEWGLSPQE